MDTTTVSKETPIGRSWSRERLKGYIVGRLSEVGPLKAETKRELMKALDLPKGISVTKFDKAASSLAYGQLKLVTYYRDPPEHMSSSDQMYRLYVR